MTQHLRSAVNGLRDQVRDLAPDDGRRVQVMDLTGQVQALLGEAERMLREAERALGLGSEEPYG